MAKRSGQTPDEGVLNNESEEMKNLQTPDPAADKNSSQTAEENNLLQALMEKVKALEAALHEKNPSQAKEEKPSGEAVDVKKNASEKWLEEKVQITLFKDGEKYKDDVDVIINGKITRIQRGIPVKVPRKIALQLELSGQQDAAATQYILQQESDFEKNRNVLS